DAAALWARHLDVRRLAAGRRGPARAVRGRLDARAAGGGVPGLAAGAALGGADRDRAGHAPRAEGVRVPGAGRLRRTDTMNRVVETIRDHFDPVTEDPIGDGESITTYVYDGLERLVEVDIDAGMGVNDDTTYESYVYDGRSLLVAAADNDSEVERTHDSLGAILSETQTYSPMISLLPFTPYTVSYERDGVGNDTETTYPAGRVIERSFDGLRRTKRIDEDSTQLVELDYLGPSLLRRTYLEVDTQSDYGYDLARRMISSEHAESTGPTLFDVR